MADFVSPDVAHSFLLNIREDELLDDRLGGQNDRRRADEQRATRAAVLSSAPRYESREQGPGHGITSPVLNFRNANPQERAPLHRRIRRDIETQIMAGVLKPGDRIPFEHELMRQYECSRMTVNKALSALAATGLIGRQRGIGSVVAQPRIHMAALAIPDIREEIVKRGFRYGLKLLAREILSGSTIDEQRMRLPRGGEVLSLLCLHIADERAFAVEDRLISLAAVPEALDVDFAQTPPGSWLLAHVPWTEAEHKIMATQALGLASVLDVEPQTACLILERKTWRAGRSITHVRQTFPADCFDLTAHFISDVSTG